MFDAARGTGTGTVTLSESRSLLAVDVFLRARLLSSLGRSEMYITAKKEQFSRAFMHALCAKGGLEFRSVEVDDDSVDHEVVANRSLGTKIRAPQLGVQLKCTETDDGNGDHLVFPLPMKNYDDLRDPRVHIPRILVVLAVPEALDAWLNETTEQTAMRRCAYWASLRGMPDVSNETTRTVRLPRGQLMNSSTLLEIMKRIGDGGLP